MSKKKSRMCRIMAGIVFSVVGIAAVLSAVAIVLYATADFKQPEYSLSGAFELVAGDSLRTYGPDTLKLNDKGLWEMKVCGNGFERGEAIGIIAGDLVYFQEKVFVEQIERMIPDDSYLNFLRYVVLVFNRNLGKNMPEEYRNELYALSLSCTHEFDAIGSPYVRQMNYHSAHDLGHALQDYMLVGCSSFACKGKDSADGSLIIGRNFDFYMGDDFARNKLLSFYFPDGGYKFASVGWPGMIGVMSGMNEKGLTVTINAAKSDIPVSSATPISILSREILQYASNIDEAYAIACSRKTFVSESLLIGSAADGRAAIIEKSPEKTALYDTGDDSIICTNHYQSDEFENDRRNIENIRTTDSKYRYDRIAELIGERAPVDVEDAAYILRNRDGLGGKKLGNTNEMAVNQLIAHHSVIFKPDSLVMWVSTPPWQCGEYIAYDLGKIFEKNVNFTGRIYRRDRTVAADPLLESSEFDDVLKYRILTREIETAGKSGGVADTDLIREYISSNPYFYHVYSAAGDYFRSIGEIDSARVYWSRALECEIPKLSVRQEISDKISEDYD